MEVAKVKYEGMASSETTALVSPQEPRRFHSHFINCFGNCDAVGWESCCLVYWCPCVAFGMNVAKTTGNASRGITFALLLLVAFAGVCGSFVFLLFGLFTLFCVVSLLSLAGLATLGISNRRHTRRHLGVKYDVEGDLAECCDDTWAWLLFPYGLCQETRTLRQNNVQDGVWLGTVDMQTSVV